MEPQTRYTHKISTCLQQQKKLKSKRNYITAAKLITFITAAYMAYTWYAAADYRYAILLFALLILFLSLNIVDSRLLSQLTYLEKLIALYKTELSYLKGDFSTLPTGEKYKDDNHSYAKDLDLFGDKSLFQAINRTVFPNGTDCLANKLKNPLINNDLILKTQEATAELSNDMDWVDHFRAIVLSNTITQVGNEKIEKWISTSLFFKKKYVKYLLYIANTIMLILLFGAFFYTPLINITLFYFVIQLFISICYARKINRTANFLDQFISGFGNYYYPISLLKNKIFNASYLNKIKNALFSPIDATRSFKKIKSIMEVLDGRGNALSMLLFNGLYMRDLHTMLALDKWKNDNISHIIDWRDSLCELDVLISMANFRFNHPAFAIPQIDDTHILTTHSIGHPLLFYKEVVTNDFSINNLHQLYIVTGANMSGKSTFLRTVGVNWLLAISGNVVNAQDFYFTPMPLFTSMRTVDNLAEGSSYFHAEIMRLKAMIDAIATSSKMFIILDEILKGTNSKDKLNGSQKFLKKLMTLPVVGLIATHDLELGELSTTFPQHFFNICFEIDHRGDDIVYSYQLQEGISQNMNASILLQQLGIV